MSRALKLPIDTIYIQLGNFIQLAAWFMLKHKKYDIDVVDQMIEDRCIEFLNRNAPPMKSIRLSVIYNTATFDVQPSGIPIVRFKLDPLYCIHELGLWYGEQEPFRFNPFNIIFYPKSDQS